ncbi:KAP family P-loop NTPase fold protein [Sphingopyxis sp. Root1497]|uniref:KAP family P-loop NTPase fold protein n=1 Tax=Sphingopyxis sp. Root1497 TaxID=1736474 RepID=UPI0012E34104|nr:P-loop NTPase fold protein [Sphingopyxis sp. Root1497]
MADNIATGAGIRGDRILRDGDPDRLGFEALARRLAMILTNPTIGDSLVVGLEGRWGSGKSSLLRKIENELDEIRADYPHSLVHFRPWLIGSRDALLAALFDDLSVAIDSIEADRGDASRSTKAKATKAINATRDFAAALGKLGGVIELAGTATALGPLAAAGKWVKELGGAARRDQAAKSLSTLKVDLAKALEALGHRIIVTIDDLDRLEPSETLEVLRLARSVADLPNVVYLICYDSEVIARNIKHAANVDDGHAFLEKVVQLTIMVPQPETFQLRYWFAEELNALCGDLSDEARTRLRTVADQEGGKQLRTPRAVNRALDAVRLLWPPLREVGLDFVDLVWLQLIKDANPRLYRWIEEYCATAAEIAIGAGRVDEEDRTDMLQSLLACVEPGYFDDIHYRYNFAEQLPGLDVNYAKDEGIFTLFTRFTGRERDRAIASRRLMSPDHYRYYFALSNPSHALLQADYDRFWAAVASGSNGTAALILEYHCTSTNRPMGKADMLFDRIGGAEGRDLVPAEAEHLLIALSNVLDEAYRKRPFDIGWVFSLWDRAERLVPKLLASLDAEERRARVIDTVFRYGKAISWVSSLYRHDIFYQGKFGDEKKPPSEWLFTSEELERISQIMNQRFEQLTLDEFLLAIEARRMLFTWVQGGGGDAAKEFIDIHLSNNDSFLRILETLRSVVSTSDGQFYVIKRSNLGDFLDYQTARERVSALAKIPSDLQKLAGTILTAFEEGENY